MQAGRERKEKGGSKLRGKVGIEIKREMKEIEI